MNCERPVVVSEVSNTSLKVVPSEDGLCAQCQTSGRCRADWLGKFSGPRQFEIPLDAPISVKAGDAIDVELDSAAILKDVGWLYGAPLCGLLLGAMVAEALSMQGAWGLLPVVGCVGIGWWVARMRPKQRYVKVKR